jgi:predicted nucleic acid-binding protein
VILVDTSIWVDHTHKPDRELENLLRMGQVMVHPFVMGEVALGSFPGRTGLLDHLSGLRRARTATDEEVLQLIEDWQLWGTGIGYMDVHLLASVLLTPTTRLWTRDKRLKAVAEQLSLDPKLH